MDFANTAIIEVTRICVMNKKLPEPAADQVHGVSIIEDLNADFSTLNATDALIVILPTRLWSTFKKNW